MIERFFLDNDILLYIYDFLEGVRFLNPFRTDLLT
jgi:hypothetical protein